MSDICESCGCPEGVDGHDVLTRRIDELEKSLQASGGMNNLATAIGTMGAEERSNLCHRISALEKQVRDAYRLLSNRRKDLDYDIKGTPSGCDSMPSMVMEVSQIKTWEEEFDRLFPHPVQKVEQEEPGLGERGEFVPEENEQES